MAHIAPTNPQVATQPLLLTAYWNTETKAYAVAFIPSIASIPFENDAPHGLSILIPHLRDESINLRLVCKAMSQPGLRVQYQMAPLDPPRQSPQMNRIVFTMIQRVQNTKLGHFYSNPTINLNRSLSLEECRAFQYHFNQEKSLPRVILKASLLSIEQYPSAKKLTISYYGDSNPLDAFPNIEQILFTNPDEHPPVLKNLDPLFMQQSENSLKHLKEVEFDFTSAHVRFSRAGLEHFIRNAPNLRDITLDTSKRHILGTTLSELRTLYPHIKFTNMADEL